MVGIEPTAKVPELAFTVMVCVFWPETVAARLPEPKMLIVEAPLAAPENQTLMLSLQFYQHHLVFKTCTRSTSVRPDGYIYTRGSAGFKVEIIISFVF